MFKTYRFKPGEYEVSFGLFEPNPVNPKIPHSYTPPNPYPFPGRPIGLGLVDAIRDTEGFYRVGTMEITEPEVIPHEGVVIVPSLWLGHPKGQG